MGEPMMKVEVTTPEEYMGDVIGDINSRRGMVAELGERGNMKTVRAKVPLANMFQYVSDLRSATKGRASYQMNLDSYELVPPNVEKDHVEVQGQHGRRRRVGEPHTRGRRRRDGLRLSAAWREGEGGRASLD